MTAISDKKAELNGKMTNLGQNIISTRIEIIKKMILTEETFNPIGVGDHSEIIAENIGASGKVLHEVCQDLGKQRAILRGASNIDMLSFILPIASDFTGTIASTIKTPTSTNISYKDLKTLNTTPVIKTLNDTPNDPDYFGNFFLTKDKTDANTVFFADEGDKTHLNLPVLNEDNEVILGYFFPEGSFRQTVPFTKLVYKNTDVEIAIIKVNSIRVGYITPLGVVRSDNISGLIINELKSGLDIENKLFTLAFSDYSSAGADHLVTLHYTDNTAGDALTEIDISSNYNENAQVWTTTLTTPNPSTIEIYQNSIKIALIDDNGSFVGLKLDSFRSKFDISTSVLMIKPKIATSSDTIEIKYKKLTKTTSSSTIGKFSPSSTITLEDLSGTANYTFPTTINNIVHDGVPRDSLELFLTQTQQIILYNGAGNFTVDETITGSLSGAIGYVVADNTGNNQLTFYQQSDTLFVSGEIITGGTSLNTCTYLGNVSIIDIDSNLNLVIDNTTTIAGTYTGEHTNGTIVIGGTIDTSSYNNVAQISTLTFDDYPNKKVKLKLKYSHLIDKTTFDATYDQVPLTAQGSSSSGTETIKTITYASITNYVANTLGQILYVRKKTDYSVYAQLEISCHGLEADNTWAPNDEDWSGFSSGSGDDSTILNKTEFRGLMAWLDPSGDNDLMRSCDPSRVSFVPQSGYDDATVETENANINNSPFFAAIAGDDTARGTSQDETTMVGGNKLLFKETTSPADGVDTFVWSMLSKQKWTYQLNLLYGNVRNPAPISPDENIDIYSFPADGTFKPDLADLRDATSSANPTVIPAIGGTWDSFTNIVAYNLGTPLTAQDIAIWFDSATKLIKQKKATGVGPYTWASATTATHWWNDFVTSLTAIDSQAKVTHIDTQVTALRSLGYIADPNTDEVDDTNFWDDVDSDTGFIMDIFEGEFTTKFGGFASNSEAANSTFASLKTLFGDLVVGTGETFITLSAYYDSCFHISTGRLKALNDRVGIDINAGYNNSIYDALNVMTAKDIAYFKDPIKEESNIQSLLDNFDKNLNKWKFYDGI